MHAAAQHDLPARIGQGQLETIIKNAAPCGFYLVHPQNQDKVPCFISGYKVFLLEGAQERGVVLYCPHSSELTLQRTEMASGVSNHKPCLVPIDGMHGGVHMDAKGCISPHFVRTKVFAVIDAYGVVKRDNSPREGFPQAGQEAYLFPHGIQHHGNEPQVSKEIATGLAITGLYRDGAAQIVPVMNNERRLRGVPVLSLTDAHPCGVAWV